VLFCCSLLCLRTSLFLFLLFTLTPFYQNNNDKNLTLFFFSRDLFFPFLLIYILSAFLVLLVWFNLSSGDVYVLFSFLFFLLFFAHFSSLPAYEFFFLFSSRQLVPLFQ
jgi:hypothetical protein